MSRSPFTVGLVQDSAGADRGANLARAEAAIREARSRGAQVICLQELFNAPYFCKSLRVENFEIAEPIPGPVTTQLGKLAAELSVVLVVPIYERQASGLYRNSAAVIDADGSLLGVYRKSHIPDGPGYQEKYYFRPGDTGFKAWKTRYGTIGVGICWDQWYPEAARLMALDGADLLLYPTAIGWDPRDDEGEKARQREAWITVQRGHAVANSLPLLAVNRVGHEASPIAGEAGIQFWGSSFVAGPQGEFLAQAGTDAPELLLCDIDRARCEQVRRIWPFLRDRRIDAYHDLLKRFRS